MWRPFALREQDLHIIFRHLLPNSIGPIIIQATLRIGSSILLASFLGLGAQPPTPEWGAMLSAARNYVWTTSYLALIGIAITITVVAVNLIGDALRDYLDQNQKYVDVVRRINMAKKVQITLTANEGKRLIAKAAGRMP